MIIPCSFAVEVELDPPVLSFRRADFHVRRTDAIHQFTRDGPLVHEPKRSFSFCDRGIEAAPRRRADGEVNPPNVPA